MAGPKLSSWVSGSKLETDQDGVQFYGWFSKSIERRDDELKYTVKEKDTLPNIAHKFYGDHRLWLVIAEANGGILEVLIEGIVLNIPNPVYVKARLL